MASIEVQGLTKRFGDVLAVDDLSFTAHEGTVTGFLGPNGAGKTTTLRIVLGLVRPSSGRALVNGRPYDELPDAMRVVGAVLESSGFHPARTARDHLRSIAMVDGIPVRRVDEVLETVGLAADARRRVGGYSMGMRQRLELARALLGDPEVLILDEPANGLDPQGIAWLRGFLRWYASLGRVVLISSHLLAEAAQTVDEVIVVNHGRMAGAGSLTELRARQGGSVRVRALDPDRLAGLLADAGFAVRRQGEEVVEATGTTAESVGRLMAEHGVVVLEMTTEGESLEELFFEMTAGRAPDGLVRAGPNGAAGAKAEVGTA
ncbi:MAG: ATP-binding cassette domain-containing protein [Acidobacteriota bacterium]|nr:ATP-binding cassette domain-containing protein [Acidobacteriota bacterium]